MHTFLVSLLLWLSSRFKIRLGPFCPCPMARPWAYRGNVEEGTYSLTEKFNISFAPLLSILLDVCFLLLLLLCSQWRLLVLGPPYIRIRRCESTADA